VREEPIGTTYGALQLNPEVDASTDCGNLAFVTGNGVGAASAHNLDNGFTEISSPLFDLTSYTNPYINYSRWFSSPSNVPVGNRDTLFIRLGNGITTVDVEAVSHSSPGIGTWVSFSAPVSSFITATANMQLKVFIEDKSTSGNLVEAGFDAFSISEGPQGLDENKESEMFSIFPNPGNGQFMLKNNIAGTSENMFLKIYDSMGRLISSEQIVKDSNYLYGSKIQSRGLYLVGIYVDGQLKQSQKLIKNN